MHRMDDMYATFEWIRIMTWKWKCKMVRAPTKIPKREEETEDDKLKKKVHTLNTLNGE